MTITVIRQMIGAELLKLRRNRGLVAFSALFTVGCAITYFTIAAVLHMQSPATHGPAGGSAGFERALVEAVGWTASVAAVLIGATAGSADIDAGVFRDLAATGRSRIALFSVRVAGALLVLIPLLAVTLGVCVAGSVIFAGGLPAVSAATVAQFGSWLAVSTVLAALLALGLATSIGSRTAAVGALVAWQMGLAVLLSHLDFLGQLRQGISVVATSSLLPHGAVEAAVTPTLGVAAAVIVGWVALALGAGAWRTATADA